MKTTCHTILLGLSLLLLTLPGRHLLAQAKKARGLSNPNIILLFADDIGYVVPSINGNLSFSTPHIDALAESGMRFQHCYSQPVCAPSRAKLLTGRLNPRNKSAKLIPNPSLTIGNYLKKAGYRTAIVGKKQLMMYEDESDHIKSVAAKEFGFDEYCFFGSGLSRWQGNEAKKVIMVQNGEKITSEFPYLHDHFTDFALDFITRNKDTSFFLYFPALLAHAPFIPTPDSKEWEDPDNRFQTDPKYYPDMAVYLDKVVGQLVTKLEELKIRKQTVFIFLADNGCPPDIRIKTANGIVSGGKHATNEAGTHVPLFISWPEEIPAGAEYAGLIDFTDFAPTLAALAGETFRGGHGVNFLPLLMGAPYEPRAYLIGGEFHRKKMYARTRTYKLYRTGNFYNLNLDLDESEPVKSGLSSLDEIKTRKMLNIIMQKVP